jgi:hypothetical protein
VAVLSLFWGLTGCGSRTLLTNVQVRPDIISPNADGKEDVAQITYTVTENADISIYFLDQAGQRHDFRINQRRSLARQPYVALFGGAIDGRLLPDGIYTCVIEAKTANGRSQKIEKKLTLQGGDPERIEIRNLTIGPNEFTPNRDGISDRVTIGYYLTKEAAQLEIYITDSAGNKYPVPEDRIREPLAKGNHEHDYDAGIDLSAAPPADGDYTVWVVAEDAVGNRDVQTGTLTIRMGGVPIVGIVNRAAKWSTTVVPLGSTLTFTCTVQNFGRVPVRTKGPPPGATYTTSENFNTLSLSLGKQLNKDFYEEPGIFRIGVDFEGNTSGRPYPYRWQLGKDEELTIIEGEHYLMPGQSVTVWGSIKIMDKPNKIAPYYWLGLLHEQVRWVEENVERTQISIGF